MTVEVSDWATLAKRHLGRNAIPAALIGNGVSVAIHERFAYKSLVAVEGDELPDSLVRMFEKFGPDPELILGRISHASFISRLMDDGRNSPPMNWMDLTAALDGMSDALRSAIPEAIRNVHPHATNIDGVLQCLCEGLEQFSSIFTTNHDLLTYWAMNRKPNVFDDRFRTGGAFRPSEPLRGATVWYLHGGFHLRRDRWTTQKIISSGNGNLLDQSNKPEEALVVLEGDSAAKEEVIKSSDYLSAALGALRTVDSPIVVLGHSLSDVDFHIATAIDASQRSVFVSVFREDGSAAPVIDNARRNLPSVNNKRLYFFWHDTHPLFQCLNVATA